MIIPKPNTIPSTGSPLPLAASASYAEVSVFAGVQGATEVASDVEDIKILTVFTEKQRCLYI